MDGLKLPKGALDREKMKTVLSRLDALEKTNAALEKKLAMLEKAAEKKK